MAIRARARNLPHPTDLRPLGRGVEAEYRKLLRQLVPSKDGSALVHGPGGFSLPTHTSPVHEEDALRLLTVLWRPDSDTLESLAEELNTSEGYAKATGQLDESVFMFANARRFRVICDLINSLPYRNLSTTLAAQQYKNSAGASITNAPGFSWCSWVSVAAFSHEWDSVLLFTDAEDDDANAFPVFLGFSRAGGDWRPAGQVLRANAEILGLDYRGGSFDVSGDPLLAVCSTSVDCGKAPAEALLALSDEDIEKLDSAFGGIASWEGISALNTLTSYAAELGARRHSVRTVLRCLGDVSRFKDSQEIANELEESARYDAAVRRRKKRKAPGSA